MKKKTVSHHYNETNNNLEVVESWLLSKQKYLLGITITALGVLGINFAFNYYIDNQENIAQQELFRAVDYFERDSLEVALNGDGNNLGVAQIVDDYPFTKSANLATYYAGIISLKQDDFERAISYLSEFKTDVSLIQSRAYSLIGDAHMELDDYAKAAEYYHEAGTHHSNKFFSPNYLMKEALAHEKGIRYDKARKAYQQIINQYWESDEYSDAKKFQAKLPL